MNAKTSMPNPIVAADLAQARCAISALVPHLPEPRLSEWMTAQGVNLPAYEVLSASNSAAILDTPITLLEGLGPYCVNSLPKQWIAAHERRKERWNRNLQLLRLYPACLRAEAADGEIPALPCDGVIAGLLMLLIRPRLSKLRERFVRLAVTHPFGSYLTTCSMLLEEEHFRVLESIAMDSRLAAALCWRDPSAACDLPERLLAGHDLWSATTSLYHARSQQWLEQVLTHAAKAPAAAVAALTLQPNCASLQEQWIAVLLQSAPIFAYQAARWTRWTWPPNLWIILRNRLRTWTIRDLGCAFFHWYRDVEPLKAAEALRNENLDVLWAAELIQATADSGLPLRQRCSLRLRANPSDAEAKLVLQWLNQGSRSH